MDTLRKHLSQVLKRAHAHRGASFVEIFQNCIVYNDGVFGDFTEKAVAADNQLHVEDGKPLLFGSEGNRGLRMKSDAFELDVVTVGEDGVGESDVLVHDEKNHLLATMLAALQPPVFPMALGVLYCDPAPGYEVNVMAQIAQAKAKSPATDLNALLRQGHTWTV